MNKNRIRLSESQLHKVIKESVKRVLREYNGTGRSAQEYEGALERYKLNGGQRGGGNVNNYFDGNGNVDLLNEDDSLFDINGAWSGYSGRDQYGSPTGWRDGGEQKEFMEWKRQDYRRDGVDFDTWKRFYR